MVNKHYKIQNTLNQNSNGNSTDKINGDNKVTTKNSLSQKFNIGTTTATTTKHYSPPVIRNSSRITNSPNPYDSPIIETSIVISTPLKEFKQQQQHNHHQRTSLHGVSGNKSLGTFNTNYNGGDGNGSTGIISNNIENTYEQLIIDDKYNNGNNNFGRNIALSYDTVSLASETYHKIGGQRQFDIKDITVNDIGRFQYIVQMDKDEDTTFYNQPASGSSSSSSTSDDRNSVSNRSLSFKNFPRDKINFWKTDTSKYHLSTSTSTSLTLRERAERLLNWQKNELNEHLRTCWDYSRWPIFLLLSCLVLGSLIYILYLGSYRQSNNNSERFIIAPPSNFIDNNNLDYSEYSGEYKNVDTVDEDLLKKFIITTKIMISTSEEINTPSVIKNPETTTINNEKKYFDMKNNATNKNEEIKQTITSTTKIPVRNTKILKFTTKAGFKKFEDDDDIFDEVSGREFVHRENQEKTILSPVKPNNNGHTSGHQNNFGIPIEDDEKILKLFDDELIRLSNQESSTSEKPEPTSTLKVSPTLPIIIHHKDTSPGIKPTTETIYNTNQDNADINVCQSTSLDMCQGILQYDLTTTKSKQLIGTMDMAHFKYLIASNCSNRAAEFVCSFLEPECRPLGSLEPCKRICKSILEPCSSIIASSEILTMTFDCDRYPDSSDRNVCEDPTRRNTGKCHDNEFKCLDSTCIPKQWSCDNIKDCSLGEDEDNCKFCHHEEFRCQSDSSCIPGNLQCDGYEDCSDGSDENDCLDYDPTNTDNDNDDDIDGGGDGDNEDDSNYDDEFTEDYPMPRIYSFASIQSPDNPDSLPFFAIPIDEDGKGSEMIEETSNRGGGLFDKDNASIDLDENINENNKNQTNSLKENTKSDNVSKSLANFQDSTEIMMTSDSEYDFKYSKYRTNRTRNTVAMAKRVTGTSSLINNLKRSPTTASTESSITTTTDSEISLSETTTEEPLNIETTFKPNIIISTTEKINLMPEILSESIKYCPDGELRCVTGECITVDQLCDKKIDCPDGADEARCTYKDDKN